MTFCYLSHKIRPNLLIFIIITSIFFSNYWILVKNSLKSAICCLLVGNWMSGITILGYDIGNYGSNLGFSYSSYSIAYLRF